MCRIRIPRPWCPLVFDLFVHVLKLYLATERGAGGRARARQCRKTPTPVRNVEDACAAAEAARALRVAPVFAISSVTGRRHAPFLGSAFDSCS